MDTKKEILQLLDRALNLGGRYLSLSADAPLLGAVPELDSMAVVSVIAAIEEHFGIVVDDDEIDGSTFKTVGSLTEFAERKLNA